MGSGLIAMIRAKARVAASRGGEHPRVVASGNLPCDNDDVCKREVLHLHGALPDADGATEREGRRFVRRGPILRTVRLTVVAMAGKPAAHRSGDLVSELGPCFGGDLFFELRQDLGFLLTHVVQNAAQE